MKNYKTMTLNARKELYDLIYLIDNFDYVNSSEFIDIYPFDKSLDEELHTISEIIDCVMETENIELEHLSKESTLNNEEDKMNKMVSCFSTVLEWLKTTNKSEINTREYFLNVIYYITTIEMFLKKINLKK